MKLRGLLVDYGGVLTNPLGEVVSGWLRTEEVDPDRFADLMRRWFSDGAPPSPVHDLETGRMSAADFERRLAAELLDDADAGADVARREPARRTAGLLTRMFAGMRVEPSMVDVVRTARAAGLRTGLLSNSWGLDYARDDWAELFDAVVISGEVGLRKPDPAIYALAADRLGLSPGQIVFVDDLTPNVRGAVVAGMVGVRHTDVGTTIGELEILFGLTLR